MNLSIVYFLKALDNYPYNIEFAIENLNYSLSYDDGYAPALCLMGRIYANEIKDYSIAEEYFIAALAADLNYSETYIYYAEILLKLNRIEELSRILEHSFCVPGIEKEKLYQIQAHALEQEGKLAEAAELLRNARATASNCSTDAYYTGELTRIEGKLKKLSKRRIRKQGIQIQWVETYSIKA